MTINRRWWFGALLGGFMATPAMAQTAADRLENRGAVRETADERTETKEGDVEKKVERAAEEAGKELSDTWITTKVKAALVGAKGLDKADISVDTNSNGVVTLTGTVPNDAARARAISTTKGIEGVKQVKDALVTKRAARPPKK